MDKIKIKINKSIKLIQKKNWFIHSDYRMQIKVVTPASCRV